MTCLSCLDDLDLLFCLSSTTEKEARRHPMVSTKSIVESKDENHIFLAFVAFFSASRADLGVWIFLCKFKPNLPFQPSRCLKRALGSVARIADENRTFSSASVASAVLKMGGQATLTGNSVSSVDATTRVGPQSWTPFSCHVIRFLDGWFHPWTNCCALR